MKQLLKIHRWWDYQLTIMLGLVYHIMATASTMPHLPSWLFTFVLFVLACIGIAGFGHLVNDYFDRESDRRSGAPNLVMNDSALFVVAKTVAVLSLAWVPWLWLPTDSVILGLVVFEFVLFIMYSLPGVRFKERGLLGPVADSLYSYTVSTSVATLVFARLAHLSLPMWLSLLIASWSFLLGLRQILAHQIEDASRDERTGLRTFVTTHGWRRTRSVLEWYIFPGEMVLFLMLMCVLARHSAGTFAGFAVYVLVVGLVNRRQSIWSESNPWKLPPVSRLTLLNNKLLFRFYTEWFPILGLIALIARDRSYLPVAALHFVLFNNGLKSMIGWCRDTARELEFAA